MQEGLYMIRIAISCGEGFSSGFLANYLQKETVQQGLQDKVSFVRIPFYQLKDKQDEVDIAMIMPHIEWKLKEAQGEFRIPLYVIPFKAIVKPTLQDFIDDAEDILAMADGRGGRFCFPGEEHTAAVSRLCSHRAWIAKLEKERA
jgi:cellobiose-specific phosphotransferase system component IIB